VGGGHLVKHVLVDDHVRPADQNLAASAP
jgi:hypothetical protein